MDNESLRAGAEAYQYPLLIGQLLHTPLATTPEREIVYADQVRYDYHGLRERIGRLASALSELGVRPRVTVAVLDWDSHRYLECFFAVPMMGAVLHMVNVRLAPEQILYTINHAEDDVILVHRDFVPLIEGLSDRLERPPTLVLLADDAPPPDTRLDFAAEYEAMLQAASSNYSFPDFDENTRATTFYTTGTTGDPKGVHFSHRQIVLHTLGVAVALSAPQHQGRLHRDDVYMPITPMFHVHAWGIPYVTTLLGLKQVYPGRYLPEALLDLIEREGVTFSHCVPALLHMLLSHPKSLQVDLSRWKAVIGGSALPSGLARAALERGIDVWGGYGLSETGPVLTLAQLDTRALELDVERQIPVRTKCGRPLPLVDLHVVDDYMQELPHDGQSVGEVVVRSPWLAPSYLKSPEASDQLWRGGYLHTGDLGHIDPQGYLKVVDRTKDVIKSGGEWISSILLEDLVSQVPGVAEVAAIGIPDDKWGERPLVLVVADTDATLEPEAIRAHLKHCVEDGLLAGWAVPEQIRVVDAIEKTSVGKLDKKRLRQKYGGF